MGLKLILLNKRRKSSAQRRVSYPVALIGGCGVTVGSTGRVRSAGSTDAMEAGKGCAWAHENEGEPADTPDKSKYGPRAGGT